LGVVPRVFAGADQLSETLECLGLSAWIPGYFDLTAPWGLQVATRFGWFYLVTRHMCWLEVTDCCAPVRAAAGDLLIVFHDQRHFLRDQADSPAVAIQTLLEPQHFERRTPLRHGGGREATRLLAGCFCLDGLEQSPLHAALPPYVHIKGERGRARPYVRHMVRLLEMEAAAGESNGHSIVNRLVRILLIKALQHHAADLPDGSANWLRALADPDVGRALALMHAEPHAHWTVAALAERVAMSRSRFASRFVELVGQPPLEYLTRWRMQKACWLLRTTPARLKEVAIRVGYESTSAFSKAFAHAVGSAPGAYRRCSQVAAAVPPGDALSK
jgi:AraC-like DNA-binding protein